jgi:hypothetical protein
LISPLGTSNIIETSQFDKEMKKICSLKMKGVICKNRPHVGAAFVFAFKLVLHFYFLLLYFKESL